MSDSETFTARILATRTIAEHTVAFDLERPPGFEFEAGQFLSVQIPGFTPTEEDDGERMLSIASAPHDGHLTVAMRMRDSAFKRHLGQGQPGASSVLISPAMGDFVLQDDQRPVVMVAGGIGITPFYSMLRHLQRNGAGAARRVTLLYGNRSPASVAWREELDALTAELENFEVVHVFSESSESSEGCGEHDAAHAKVRTRGGFIDAGRIRADVADWQDSIYYVVGPTAMVGALQDSLDACGVPPEQVVAEFFAGY
ncbi:ferredoxin--NADP reductase [Cupriavidus sp. 2TAF22]|uniref:ferredoxin--NADP reductase n=1 Tax=unclassified Cupriavidus TaxID=2640874 RepID=UPI003F8F40F3